MKKLIIFLSLIFISSVSAMEETLEMGVLWNDDKVWSENTWIFQDWSVENKDTSIQENNVVSWEIQVTDTQVINWDQIVNMWTETSLTNLNEEEIDLNSAWLSWEINSWVTMWNLEVNVLPTTWLEESLLILASLFLSWLIIFRNKFIKK